MFITRPKGLWISNLLALAKAMGIFAPAATSRKSPHDHRHLHGSKETWLRSSAGLSCLFSEPTSNSILMTVLIDGRLMGKMLAQRRPMSRTLHISSL